MNNIISIVHIMYLNSLQFILRLVSLVSNNYKYNIYYIVYDLC